MPPLLALIVATISFLFNMLFLSRYMPQVVELFGPVRSFLIFMAAGIGGFLVSNFAGVSSTIGASGGLFGLLAALIVYGRRTGQSHITNQLWGSAIMMFLFSFMMSGVNNWAHGGGFAAGFVAAEALRFSHERTSGKHDPRSVCPQEAEALIQPLRTRR